jgi:peptidoglycan/LPS O-acetylase OafA/YrhL
VFFVVSGYCIAANVWAQKQGCRGIKLFLLDRALRIYPTYWIACGISVLSNLVAEPFNGVPLSVNLPASFKEALASILLIEPYFGVKPFLLVSWTLVYEIGFYIVAAIGLALWRMGVAGWALLGLGLLVASLGLCGWHPGTLYILDRWPEFFLGGLVFGGICVKSGFVDRVRLTNGFAVTALLVTVLVSSYSVNRLEFVTAGVFSLALFLLHPWDQQIVGWNPALWLGGVGRISYSLYLTHAIFMGKFLNFASRRVNADSLLQLPLQIIGWTIALVGGWVVFQFCEQPIERWRCRWRKSLGRS